MSPTEVQQKSKPCPCARNVFLFVMGVERFKLKLFSADKAQVDPCDPAPLLPSAPLPLEIPLLSPSIFPHMETF